MLSKEHTMRCIVLAGLLIAISSIANAQSTLQPTGIAVQSTPAGSIAITLSWQVNHTCIPLETLGYPPAVVIVGQQIRISSTNYFFDCGGDFPVNPPYTAWITADVGPLPDGTYSVVWSFPTASGQPYPVLTAVTSEFRVIAGSPSVVSIPTIDLRTAVVLALGLALIGWRSLS